MKLFSSDDLFLVSGASRGIGKAVAYKLLGEGAKVAAIARDAQKLADMKENSPCPENVFVYETDLTDTPSIVPLVKRIAAENGLLKGMAHCAGISQTIAFNSQRNRDKELFNINVHAGAELARGVMDKKCTVGNGASIVFISSVASVKAFPGAVAYAASKGALNALTVSLAAEAAARKIRVNAVLPGFVKTDMLDELVSVHGEEIIDKINSQYPLGIGEAEDVAETVAFVLSDKAKWMTGSLIKIDGGGTLV
ncbi:SDR family NAD(P)-dependent oxidoreductase [Seleniivibrio woodruffii]|uniref:SDR family NAD(P)-dependent oxidoreductase n=1 Tax=Seleniivibrio woodruffii TaxID=1078050 RepID=UPI0026F1552B|nr:SDR family oxidoreductase [Seleniivibrio woodruffii]